MCHERSKISSCSSWCLLTHDERVSVPSSPRDVLFRIFSFTLLLLWESTKKISSCRLPKTYKVRIFGQVSADQCNQLSELITDQTSVLTRCYLQPRQESFLSERCPAGDNAYLLWLCCRDCQEYSILQSFLSLLCGQFNRNTCKYPCKHPISYDKVVDARNCWSPEILSLSLRLTHIDQQAVY